MGANGAQRAFHAWQSLLKWFRMTFHWLARKFHSFNILQKLSGHSRKLSAVEIAYFIRD